MKLDPEQLKELIEKRPKLNKASTIQAAQQTQIFFASDQEMLSASIDTVLQERLMLKPNNISVIPFSGILDEESFADTDGLFTNDSKQRPVFSMTPSSTVNSPRAPCCGVCGVPASACSETYPRNTSS